MTEYQEVDDFAVMELAEHFLYRSEHPDWNQLNKCLMEQGYNPADVWNILKRLREEA